MMGPNSYKNIVGAATTVCHTGRGHLAGIAINRPIAGATITVYDSVTGSGTKLATITLPATLLEDAKSIPYFDIEFTTGLTVVTTGANLDITVAFRAGFNTV